MKKNHYIVEFYDTKKDVGEAVIEELTNKKKAIKSARDYYECLSTADKKHLTVLASLFDEDGCYIWSYDAKNKR